MNFNNSPSQVVIKGITTDGKPFEFIFNTQEEEGRLTITKSNLKSIDLSPLENCDNLRDVNLKNNSLENIDLSPLHNKKKLERLILVSNSLTSIDLTPLQSCDNFETLSLSENKLTSIDLSPLQLCDNFEILGLGKNKLTSIDLTPLQSCANFVSLSLNNNELTSIDLTPLQSCPELNFLRLNKNKFTTLDFTPIENKVPNILILEIDKWVDTGGIVKPLFSAKDKQTFILLLISLLTCAFGYLLSLYYLIRNKKQHAKWYLLTGICSTISAVFFATSRFYEGPGGAGASIATGIITLIVAYFWLWARITTLEEKGNSIN